MEGRPTHLDVADDRKAPVLLLMDSPRKEDGQRDPWTTKHHDDQADDGEALSKPSTTTTIRRASLLVGATVDPLAVFKAPTSQPESLGRLLVEMTAQVQDERSKRSNVEKKNQSLMLEIDQLQRELLELKTSKEQQSRRRASEDWDAATRLHHGDPDDAPPEANAEFWWRELQDAKKSKDAAQVDAHNRAMEVMELNACVSMQHDELKAVRASEADVRFSLTQAEGRCKEMLQQHTIMAKENALLKHEVSHLNGEMGKRGSHFKALMDKWSEAQAQSEHLERENRAMLDKMKELRGKHELFQAEMDKMRDERDLLQHQANHLKGAVAAKAAESKAFQAYGSNARDHLQAQNAMIQRQQIYRRKVHGIARDSVVLVKSIKAALASVRAPLVLIQNDFRVFLKNLQTPVISLVGRSKRYAEVAYIEHQPLRLALANAELTRRHLHEQLWRARRNALLVCQIRNDAASPSQTTATSTADSILATPTEPPAKPQRTLRANYGTTELLLRETDRDTVTVKCDALYSDRARGLGCWNAHESVTPLLQSVLDGFNACVATFDGLQPIKADSASDTGVSVPELVLTQLFETVHHYGAHFHRAKLTISLLGVYNEAIYDLLGMDPHATTPSAGASMSKIVVLEVQNAEEALLVLRGGGETLDAAHELRVIDKTLTHKVITVCVVHENLLLSSQSTTKSKLQIVELATGATTDGNGVDWEDRDGVKAHVAMESGIKALLTTLADVRVGGDSTSTNAASTGAAFVRYHSSKLTVLLQDTVKPSSKFLGIASLPANSTSVATSTAMLQPQLDARAALATRWMFHLRNAVGSASGASNGPPISTDRTVEGFINRFTQHSQADGTAQRSTAGLAFSSPEMSERPPLVVDADPRRWEKEVDQMNHRYGDLNKFTMAFYQPAVESAARMRSAANEDDGFHETATLSPRIPSVVVTNAEQLTDVLIHPHELIAVDDGILNTQPPPAPVKNGRSKSTKGGSMVLRSLPGHRNGTKTRIGLLSTLQDRSRRRTTTVTPPAHGETTLAPRSMGSMRVTPVIKVRRETTSSALKKNLATAHATRASTAHYHHASAAAVKTNGAGSMLAQSLSATTTAAATQARLQNRKIPFK